MEDKLQTKKKFIQKTFEKELLPYVYTQTI